MMKLYACLGSGNCMKPWLALNQTGRDFELILVDVLIGEQKSDSFLAINPLGVVPYLQIDDGVGIGESNAMLWYLAEGTDLMPQTPRARAQALQWMFFEQSKLEPFISPARFFTHILPDQKDARADDIAIWQDAARSGLSHLDAHLADHRFMLDEGYSLADISVFGYTHVLEQAGLDLGDTPHIARWIEDVSNQQNFTPLHDLGRQQRRAA